MSALLRLSRLMTSTRTLQPNKFAQKTMSSQFFNPYRSPSHLGLSRSRFYSHYTPGGSSQVSANMRVLYSLMGANVAIYAYAMYLKAQAMQGFQQPFINFLQNMTMNLTDFQNGRWWTVVTANFTHIDIGHIFSNMFTVYFLGGFLATAPQVTPGRYLVIALGSAVSGAAGYLCQQYLKRQSKPGTPDYSRGLGFSGAVMGLCSVAACLAPTTKFQLYGIVPIPLWALVAGYAAYDGYYLNSADTRVGHAGHLGGLAFGMLYYFTRLRGVRF
ncbi:Nn.00g050500.m01.CDS01 [Neocucurbitaria sp. VM-36]